jgi:hypothetical protein
MVPINCKTITSIDGVALKVVELLGEWMKFPYAVGFFVKKEGACACNTLSRKTEF